HGRVVQSRPGGSQGHAPWAGRGHHIRIGSTDHRLLGRAALVGATAVDGISRVMGGPGIRAYNHPGGRRGVPRRVAAIAVDRIGLGIREAIRASQYESYRASRTAPT